MVQLGGMRRVQRRVLRRGGLECQRPAHVRAMSDGLDNVCGSDGRDDCRCLRHGNVSTRLAGATSSLSLVYTSFCGEHPGAWPHRGRLSHRLRSRRLLLLLQEEARERRGQVIRPCESGTVRRRAELPLGTYPQPLSSPIPSPSALCLRARAVSRVPRGLGG